MVLSRQVGMLLLQWASRVCDQVYMLPFLHPKGVLVAMPACSPNKVSFHPCPLLQAQPQMHPVPILILSCHVSVPVKTGHVF